MQEEKQIVEINGVKLEVDMRTARRVSNFRIGDPVRLLVKSYSSWDSFPGVLVGFDEFKNRPGIRVAYVNHGEVKIQVIHKDVDDVEICPVDPAACHIEKSSVVDRMTREINKAEIALEEKRQNLSYFESQFGVWFEAGEQMESALED